jgi:MOSC domain-containing protein YiiM
MDFPDGRVASVSKGAGHAFSKQPCEEIRLVAGLGVDGDAHSGATVKHRSRVARDPSQPNLRQAHIIHTELFDELAQRGFNVGAGDLGENITSQGVDLLALPCGARLHIGAEAVVEVTGLRNPCKQINVFQPGLINAVLDRAADGGLVRKAGVMGVVIVGGVIRPGDIIRITPPEGPFQRLEPV